MSNVSEFVKNIIQEIRVAEWYKNLLVFLGVLFSQNLFNIQLLSNVFVMFISLCFASSSIYVLNDILDLKRDRLDPEKSKRPLASGKISITTAYILLLIFFVLSLLITFIYSNILTLMILFLFFLDLLLFLFFCFSFDTF